MVEDDASQHALYDMFMHKLKETYYMENEQVDVLGDMSDAATNDDISQAFADHQSETRKQIGRLEHAFAAVDEEPEQHTTPVLAGLVEEQEQFKALFDQPELHNLHYLGAALKAERNEITAYETLLMLANKLDLGDDVTDALQQNLDEEEAVRDELKSMVKGSKIRSMLGKLTP